MGDVTGGKLRLILVLVNQELMRFDVILHVEEIMDLCSDIFPHDQGNLHNCVFGGMLVWLCPHHLLLQFLYHLIRHCHVTGYVQCG
jgi:hypothetical protein